MFGNSSKFSHSSDYPYHLTAGLLPSLENWFQFQRRPWQSTFLSHFSDLWLLTAHNFNLAGFDCNKWIAQWSNSSWSFPVRNSIWQKSSANPSTLSLEIPVVTKTSIFPWGNNIFISSFAKAASQDIFLEILINQSLT